ncbi:MAG: hypothetical protein ABSG68_09890 [Thermoguttaceae bacterium]|jgi:hypothetical protein
MATANGRTPEKCSTRLAHPDEPWLRKKAWASGRITSTIIVCGDGKRVTAGKRVPGHHLAVCVAGQIEQALGKQPEPVGS